MFGGMNSLAMMNDTWAYDYNTNLDQDGRRPAVMSTLAWPTTPDRIGSSSSAATRQAIRPAPTPGPTTSTRTRDEDEAPCQPPVGGCRRWLTTAVRSGAPVGALHEDANVWRTTSRRTTGRRPNPALACACVTSAISSWSTIPPRTAPSCRRTAFHVGTFAYDVRPTAGRLHRRDLQQPLPWHAMAYSIVADRVLLFGGSRASQEGYAGDTGATTYARTPGPMSRRT